jgi:hypothetical protein
MREPLEGQAATRLPAIGAVSWLLGGRIMAPTRSPGFLHGRAGLDDEGGVRHTAGVEVAASRVLCGNDRSGQRESQERLT